MGLFDIDRWNEIWQTIARNRKRSIMTALGVFWGIFMLIVMLGAGTGLGRLFRSSLGEMSTNTVLVQSMSTSVPYRGMAVNRNWTIDNLDAESLRRLPEVAYASGVCWGGEQHCSHQERKGDYSLIGYGPDHQHINPEKILYGRFINDIDMQQRRKVCVIGTQIWKELFPGGEDPTGKVITMNGSYYTVVGVMQRLSGFISFGDIEKTMIIPLTLIQQVYGYGKTIHLLELAGAEGYSTKQVEEAVKSALFTRHIISPDDPKAVWIMSAAEFIGKINGLFAGIALLTWIVGLGTLLAGIVGVSNIMLVLVKERTQEIGIRRALGAPPSAIIGQILSESFVLTFIAGIFGLAAAVGTLSLADSIYNQTIATAQDGVEISWQISFGMGILSLGILVVGSLLAGLIPANRALKIKAVDAIREE